MVPLSQSHPASCYQVKVSRLSGLALEEKERKDGEAATGFERECSLTLKAGSICLDISERVLRAIKQSQYIGHQHGGSLSHSPGDLSPSQGHISGPKPISFASLQPQAAPLYM